VISKLRALVIEAGFYRYGADRVLLLCLLASVLIGLIVYFLFGIYAFGISMAVLSIMGAFEFLRISGSVRKRRMLDAWPAVFELTQSGYQASIPLMEQIEEMHKSGPVQLRESFSGLVSRIDIEDEEKALDWFRLSVANRYADFYSLLNLLSLRFGLSGQVGSWSDLANQSRIALQRESEISSKHNWSMAIAKFGLLAPWVIVVLLIQRPEGLSSYQSTAGNQVMLIALLVSVIAYWMTDRIGRVPGRSRVFNAD
jgi:tight adherence protein B